MRGNLRIAVFLVVALVGAQSDSYAKKSNRWVAAGGLVFDKEGKVALVKQRATHRKEEMWTFPKGKLDPSESAEGAAVREIAEEAGLKSRISGYYGRFTGKDHHVHYFRFDLVKNRQNHDHEVKKVKFFTLKEAKKKLESRRDRKVLKVAAREEAVAKRPSHPRAIK